MFIEMGTGSASGSKRGPPPRHAHISWTNPRTPNRTTTSGAFNTSTAPEGSKN